MYNCLASLQLEITLYGLHAYKLAQKTAATSMRVICDMPSLGLQCSAHNVHSTYFVVNDILCYGAGCRLGKMLLLLLYRLLLHSIMLLCPSSADVLYAKILDCALEISPATSYSGAKEKGDIL